MSGTVSMRHALQDIAALHLPTPGMGFSDDGYGRIDPACVTCGRDDEYAVPWPCQTLRVALLGLGKVIPDATPVDPE